MRRVAALALGALLVLALAFVTWRLTRPGDALAPRVPDPTRTWKRQAEDPTPAASPGAAAAPARSAIASAEALRLQGRVLDESGAPLEGATIEVRTAPASATGPVNARAGAPLGEAATDADGDFRVLLRLDGVRADLGVLAVRRVGFELQNLLIPLGLATYDCGDLVLERESGRTLTVRDATGNECPGAQVAIWTGPGSIRLLWSQWESAEEFRQALLAAGARPNDRLLPGWEGATEARGQLRLTGAPDPPFLIAAGMPDSPKAAFLVPEEASLPSVITLPSPEPIEGTVVDRTGRPVRGARLFLLHEVEGRRVRLGRATLSREDGGFTAVGSPSVHSAIGVIARGHRITSAPVSAARTGEPLAIRLERAPVVVIETREAGSRVPLSATLATSMRISDELAFPVEDLGLGEFVWLEGVGEGRYQATFGLPGEYLVTASAPGHCASVAARITVTADDPEQLVVLSLEPEHRVSGRVLSAAEDTPLQGARVWAEAVTADPNSPPQRHDESHSGVTGEYALGNLPGEGLRVRAELEGFAPYSSPPLLAGSPAAPLEHDIPLQRPARVQGTVSWEASLHRPPFRVALESAEDADSPGIRRSLTDAEGAFAFRGVAPGEYSATAREGPSQDGPRGATGLVAVKPERSLGRASLRVAPGETADVTIDLAGVEADRGRLVGVLRGTNPAFSYELDFTAEGQNGMTRPDVLLEDGYFEFATVAPGMGFLSVRASVPGLTEPSYLATESVPVAAGRETYVEVELSFAALVKLEFHDAITGDPLGQSVVLHWQGRAGRNHSWRNLKPGGEGHTLILNAGDYDFVAVAAGYRLNYEPRTISEENPTAELRFEMMPMEATRAQVVDEFGAPVVEGRITVMELGGRELPPNLRPFFKTDEEGFLDNPLLPPGEYPVEVAGTGEPVRRVLSLQPTPGLSTLR